MNKKKTTKISISRDELDAVRQLLTRSKFGLLDSVRLAVELHELAGRNLGINSLRETIRLGTEAMKRSRESVTLDRLCEVFCEERTELRSRTLSDYRYVWRKLRERFPDFLQRKVRAVDPDDVREILQTGFRTPRQRFKARSILHSLFTYAERRRWITNNPVTPILIPRVREKEIVPLSLAEIRRLLDCVRTWESGSCAPAAGLMLFAGIRPREVERLHWRDIDFEENVICIRGANSKTGGTRHVTICAPLRALLQESARKKPHPPRRADHPAELGGALAARPPFRRLEHDDQRLAPGRAAPYLRELSREILPRLPASPKRNGARRFQPAPHALHLDARHHARRRREFLDAGRAVNSREV